MFFQHFIECIFHFNNYEKHEKYNKFPQSERSVGRPVVSASQQSRVRHGRLAASSRGGTQTLSRIQRSECLR